MKTTLFTVALLLVGSSTLAQNKKPEPAKPENRAPVITKFVSSAAIVKTCRPLNEEAFCAPRARKTVTLTVAANDPEGDPLTYEYLVTKGEIVGTGASVSWKLGDQPFGEYSVTVKVLDSKGAEAKSTLNVSVAMCSICGISDPPCPLISVTSLDESSFRGELLKFHLEVSDGYYQSRPDYIWTVTNGKIIKGQHTLWLTVETTGEVGKKVVAEVAVEGVDASCFNKASSSVLIKE